MKYIPRDEKKNELEKLTTAAMIGLGGGAAPPAGAGVVPPAGAVVGVVSPGGGGVVGSSPLALSPPSAVSASSSAKQVRSGICQDTISSLFFPFFCCFILSPHRFSSLSLSRRLFSSKPQVVILLPSGSINSVSSSPSSRFSRSS